MNINVIHKPVTYKAKFLRTEIFKDLIKASTFNDTKRWARVIDVNQNVYERTSCAWVNDVQLHKIIIDMPKGGDLKDVDMYCELCDDDVFNEELLIDYLAARSEYLAESQMENERGF